jgi:uncharacterized membrane protein (DUF485 family)
MHTLSGGLAINRANRSFLNPLRSGGIGRIWAQNAHVNISTIRATVKLIRARQGIPEGVECEAATKPELDVSTSSNNGAAKKTPRHLPQDLRGSNEVDGREVAQRVLDRLLIHTRRRPTSSRTREEVAAICDLTEELLRKAEEAACGREPAYVLFVGWWYGTCTEAAFKYLHNAEAAIARLYTAAEARAVIPEAVRRAREALSADDPMCEVAQKLMEEARDPKSETSTETLSKVIEAGHEAADRQRSRLRTFRNVLLVGMVVTTLMLVGFIVLAAFRPTLLPLCFSPDLPEVVCPTRSGQDASPGIPPDVSSGGDFFAVALLGLMGGSLSAAIFIRDLYTNTTPYNVSIPLALLKLPAGSLTAVVGMILLVGGFVPGFSAIDTQAQILAYALTLGFAQQLFTQVIDQRAQKLVASVPTKARGVPGPRDIVPPQDSGAVQRGI